MCDGAASFEKRHDLRTRDRLETQAIDPPSVYILALRRWPRWAPSDPATSVCGGGLTRAACEPAA